jgi:hypothetical protein
VERLNRLNPRSWRGWGSRVGSVLGFFLFYGLICHQSGKKRWSVDGRGSNDRSIHIGGWNLMVGTKKHFLLSFLYLGGFTWGNRSMNDTFLSFVLASFPFVVRVDRDGGVIGRDGMDLERIGNGRAVSVIWITVSHFFFPCLACSWLGSRTCS